MTAIDKMATSIPIAMPPVSCLRRSHLDSGFYTGIGVCRICSRIALNSLLCALKMLSYLACISNTASLREKFRSRSWNVPLLITPPASLITITTLSRITMLSRVSIRCCKIFSKYWNCTSLHSAFVLMQDYRRTCT